MQWPIGGAAPRRRWTGSGLGTVPCSWWWTRQWSRDCEMKSVRQKQSTSFTFPAFFFLQRWEEKEQISRWVTRQKSFLVRNNVQDCWQPHLLEASLLEPKASAGTLIIDIIDIAWRPTSTLHPHTRWAAAKSQSMNRLFLSFPSAATFNNNNCRTVISLLVFNCGNIIFLRSLNPQNWLISGKHRRRTRSLALDFLYLIAFLYSEWKDWRFLVLCYFMYPSFLIECLRHCSWQNCLHLRLTAKYQLRPGPSVILASQYISTWSAAWHTAGI